MYYPIITLSRLRSGAFQNTSHNALIDPLLLPSVNGNISWTPGDAIQATWMVGDYFITGGKPIGSDRNSVNALAYRNLSTGERISSFVTEYYPYTPPAPENWLIAPFGAIPEYLIPTGGHSEPA